MAPLTTANPCADGETVCDWVYDVTGNETLSEGSDIFIGIPLALLGLLVSAWSSGGCCTRSSTG